MRERSFPSTRLLRKGCSVGYAHQNGCTAHLANRVKFLMNVTLTLTCMMSIYLLYQVLTVS